MPEQAAQSSQPHYQRIVSGGFAVSACCFATAAVIAFAQVLVPSSGTHASDKLSTDAGSSPGQRAQSGEPSEALDHAVGPEDETDSVLVKFGKWFLVRGIGPIACFLGVGTVVFIATLHYTYRLEKLRMAAAAVGPKRP